MSGIGLVETTHVLDEWTSLQKGIHKNLRSMRGEKEKFGEKEDYGEKGQGIQNQQG